jgi:ribosome biogenesis GTPase
MITEFGWSDALRIAFAPFKTQGLIPARVTAQHRGLWRLVTEAGELNGRLTGRFTSDAAPGGHPVVGDWLAVSLEGSPPEAHIHALLPRRTLFARRAAGDRGGAQNVAANVDVAFLVAALNADLNLRRLERYLVATRDSGAEPFIVLTKSDLLDDPDLAAARVVAIAGGAAVVALSAKTGVGLDALSAWLKPGVTVALLGSSGAGKSTLLNALAGTALMDTGDIRESDARGRHTTTHRELFRLPSGALLVDTPGMRELGLLAVDDALDASFDDVTELLGQCRFSNCTHGAEPGCAIQGAIEDESLSGDRWQAYLKLQRELAFAARKDDVGLEATERAKWKQIHKGQRAKYKHRLRNQED